jgi:hypothetical protein
MPFWVCSTQAAALKNLQGLQLGEFWELASTMMTSPSGIQLFCCVLPMHH